SYNTEDLSCGIVGSPAIPLTLQMRTCSHRLVISSRYRGIMLPESPRSTGILETAIDYWKLGLPIIPLAGKRPAVSDWQHFERTIVSLRFWFGTRRCNIGLVTGDYVVIDSDTEAAEHWIREKRIESPMMVRSGGGGLHRYFDGQGLGIRNW